MNVRMTVKEFLVKDSAADAQGDRIQMAIRELMYRTDIFERDYQAGLVPRFTGFKVGVSGTHSALYEMSDDEILDGEVQFCGQWAWRNAQDPDEMLAVTVPSMKRSRCRSGERFDIGDVFFTGDEDGETVRKAVLAGREEIERFAVEAWWQDSTRKAVRI
jgi:hypothetical protein